MSNFNETILTKQLYILRDFLYHYASFKVIHNKYDDLIKYGSQEFWIYTVNSHYFQAINLWCMIFGTNNNETHWRKLGLKKEFKPILLDKLEIYEDDYNLYWQSIIDWRNKYSAHRVPGFLEPTF